MSEPYKQEWRIEIDKIGNNCLITCNGEPVYASAAHLHMEVGRPTTLHLKFPVYGPSEAIFQRHDEMTAEGKPMFTTVEIGGRHYRLIEMTEGDLDNGLFGERRSNGDAHQSL